MQESYIIKNLLVSTTTSIDLNIVLNKLILNIIFVIFCTVAGYNMDL